MLFKNSELCVAALRRGHHFPDQDNGVFFAENAKRLSRTSSSPLALPNSKDIMPLRADSGPLPLA